ncbi:sensor histidine kinase [Microbacterium aurum]|uniref:sensor histidine kinase n=1 Tax=Microbacterium aurum TaxID=36805 RepID=UPI00248DC15B|nr:histidine kinase [Microbacterium aurum]MBZ6371299.1 histidine kinase [Microbacterium hominis]
MTSIFADLRSYARAPFWEYNALGPLARRTLIVVVAVILVLDSLFRATNGGATSVTSAVVTTSLTMAVALFAWRPPVATLVLIAVALGALVAGVSEPLLAGAAVAGLVSFTCSAMLTSTYLVTLIAWLIAMVAMPGVGLQPLGAIVTGLVSIVSLLLGLALRQQFERAKTLATQLEASEREVAEQLRHERDLIADELHDIVAHEITIVALHAAVLERTEDSSTRTQSQTAIREAAVQALTDIRRVLGMVRGEENLSPERVPAPDSLEGALAASVKELRNAGIDVQVDVPEEVRLPNAPLLALIRVIRESATNVLKHATGARHVSISLRVEHDWVHLRITDDSPPAHTAGLPSSGYGIVRLRERFRVFGGSFDARREPEGWVVSAALPLTA